MGEDVFGGGMDGGWCGPLGGRLGVPPRVINGFARQCHAAAWQS